MIISEKSEIYGVTRRNFAEVLVPTESEIKTWLVSVLQHSCHVEYFLDKLRLGKTDPERPHEIVGLGNKYEWDVIKGFALQYRDPKVDFQTFIMPALNMHRQQYHHRKWNEPDPDHLSRPIHGASNEDMFVGAVDAICSLLENRGYQGGMHDYSGITEIAKKNPPHKTSWMLEILPFMRAMPQPKLEMISSLNGFPNIGLKDDVYESIAKRTHETVERLRDEHKLGV